MIRYSICGIFLASRVSTQYSLSVSTYPEVEFGQFFMDIASQASFDSHLLDQTENVCDTLTILYRMSCSVCVDMAEQYLDSDFQKLKIAEDI